MYKFKLFKMYIMPQSFIRQKKIKSGQINFKIYTNYHSKNKLICKSQTQIKDNHEIYKISKYIYKISITYFMNKSI